MKWSFPVVVAVVAFAFPAIASAEYVYDISFGLSPSFLVTGTIFTSCDNCSLNGSNIISWSLTNADGDEPITVASTDVGAQILGNPGNALTATPQAIYFNFSDTTAAEIYFSSVNGQQVLVTEGAAFGGAGYYTVCPGVPICVIGDPEGSNLQLGTLQGSVVPLPGALWLLLSGLGALGAFSRSTGVERDVGVDVAFRGEDLGGEGFGEAVELGT